MKINTSELIGTALDWAVAKCEGSHSEIGKTNEGKDNVCLIDKDGYLQKYLPSTNWAQGGPIIEREKIGVEETSPDCWVASIRNVTAWKGPTPLTAAMRCYVASKLGDSVDIPKELEP